MADAEQYRVTRGLPDKIRDPLNATLDLLDEMREAGHDAVQYPDEPFYAVDGATIERQAEQALGHLDAVIAALRAHM